MKVSQDELLDVLERTGIALHGERWKIAIADDLNISSKTLHNWLNRTYAPKPEEVLPRLLVLLQERGQQIADLVADINRGIAS